VSPTFTPADIERLADALAPRLAEELRAAGHAPTYLTAAGVADRYHLSRRWVYEHKDELGGWPVGDGPKPRWRFDAKTVAEALIARPHSLTNPAPQPAKPRKRRPPSSKTALLPIKGGAENANETNGRLSGQKGAESDY
jgi:hypothetical protein